MSDAITVRPRVVRHVSIDSGQPYADFRNAYERAVPAFDRLEAVGVVKSGGGWGAITALSDATAGTGLVNLFSLDPSPVMRLNGDNRQGITYLAGNIVRAEPGFHVDPGCFLYVPTRITITETEQGTGRISFDMPTDLMAVFDHPRLDALGAGTSKTLGTLLERLGVPVPPEIAGHEIDAQISSL
jgi:hypothetical protein